MSGAAQFTLGFGHRPALGREDFLVAPSNGEAVAWIDRWPDWPAPVLTLSGPTASGKTHLAQVWRARSGAALFDPANGMAAPAAENLVIEGAEAMADETAFLHLYNNLAGRGGSLLLTAESAPARWNLVLPDLASRLRAAPVAVIGAPEDALIEAVLVKLFSDRQLRVPAPVVAYVVRRMERSLAAASQIVAALDEAALAARRNLTVPLAAEVLDRLNS